MNRNYLMREIKELNDYCDALEKQKTEIVKGNCSLKLYSKQGDTIRNYVFDNGFDTNVTPEEYHDGNEEIRDALCKWYNLEITKIAKEIKKAEINLMKELLNIYEYEVKHEQNS